MFPFFSETSKKLSRSDAIFEFSSSNLNISLNVTIECRLIKLLDPRSTNLTSYFPFQMQLIDSGSNCVERGLNDDCTTTIEGKKCSLRTVCDTHPNLINYND